jgi:hypothetical protein
LAKINAPGLKGLGCWRSIVARVNQRVLIVSK